MKTRVVFVGTGGISRAHIEPLSKMENVELVSFCDVEIAKAEKAAEPFSAKSYANAAEMYDAEKPDAVYICLPPFAHGEAEIAAAERGIPFFVEKPVSNSLETAIAVRDAVEKAGILTCVGYMNRHRQGAHRAKALLAEDAPVLALGHWIGGPGGGWWGQKHLSGGQLIEQTTHVVDLTRFLLGEAVEVYGRATKGYVTGIDKYTNDDASLVSIQFESGAVANITSCCAVRVGGGVGLTIHAQKTHLVFRDWAMHLRIQCQGQDAEEIRGEDNIFGVEDARFINAVRTGDRSQIYSPYADGLKSAQLTIAANESIETGKPVKIERV
ncbi:Gfo/Idh/MocA family oxidoreductase [Candidatus Poribacteria bacterium]|nr:Gfo/Idh/MocA family oxidoreductase [Candidatus Poribacteria bacterium]